jgi:hypothetical protein
MNRITQAQFSALFGMPQANAGTYLIKEERQVLLALAKHVRAACILEFGVQNGSTAEMLVQGTGAVKYVGIDLPPGKVPVLEGQRTQMPKVPGECMLKYGDRFTLLLRDSRELTPRDVNCVFEFVWIDGGHDLETVRHDTQLAEAVMRRPGCIAWHDYNNPETPGVNELLDQVSRDTGRVTLIDGTRIAFMFV